MFQSYQTTHAMSSPGQAPESAPREQAGLKTELDINDERVMWHTGSSLKRRGLQRYEVMESDTPVVVVHHARNNNASAATTGKWKGMQTTSASVQRSPQGMRARRSPPTGRGRTICVV